MTEAIMKEVFERLDQIAAKIGTSTQHVWQVLVQQGMAEGIFAALFWVPFLISVLIWFKVTVPVMADKDVVESKQVMTVIPSVAFLGISFVCVLFNSWKIVYLFNPEMYALDYIRNVFGK